jgi:transcriptional regulator with XRE-family HTH domain
VNYSPLTQNISRYLMVIKRRITLKEKTIYIGEVISTLRKAKGLTQEKLANNINLDRSYISEIERNIKGPSLYTTFKLAKGLDMPPEDLIKKVNQSMDFDSLYEQEFN